MLRDKVRKTGVKKPFCVDFASGSSKESKEYIEKNTLYKNHPNGPFDRRVILCTNLT